MKIEIGTFVVKMTVNIRLREDKKKVTFHNY